MPTIKTAIKKLLEIYFPETLFALSAYRTRRGFRNKFKSRQKKMEKFIYNDLPVTVLSGPFIGMNYINEVVWGPIESKWLGTYERELHRIFSSVSARSYDSIIDIGSAEGYYSVGLARMHPETHVYSYDIDLWARSQQLRLAKINGVKNISIYGRCAPADLARHIGKRSLLICDIEGHEYSLLNSSVTPELKRCDIIVELHDSPADKLDIEGGVKELWQRFYKTHDILLIPTEIRSLDDLDESIVGKLPPADALACMDEKRTPRAKWLWLSVKSSA